METSIFSRSEMEQILKDYQLNSRFAGKDIPVKIKCTYKDTALWECDLNSGKLFPKEDKEYEKEILEALDICGALELRTSFSKEYKDVGNEKWKDWFLEKVTKHSLIPDTNFIYRHYCSGVLAPILGTDFRGLSFLLPRMVILEIERRGNQKEKKGVKLSGKDKREAFYAAREIKFIEENTRNFDWLPLLERSSMADFTNIAGSGFADMQIRREIHQAWEGGYEEAFFLTCDLMNSMAAEAEGISSCYFNRLSQKTYRVGYHNPKQLFDFLMANAVIFGKIRIELISREKLAIDSFSLEGTWQGKTTSEWYSDSIKRSNKLLNSAPK